MSALSDLPVCGRVWDIFPQSPPYRRGQNRPARTAPRLAESACAAAQGTGGNERRTLPGIRSILKRAEEENSSALFMRAAGRGRQGPGRGGKGRGAAADPGRGRQGPGRGGSAGAQRQDRGGGKGRGAAAELGRSGRTGRGGKGRGAAATGCIPV